jgi:pimeloyl-ACP methyl ester carboxylesterase
LIIAGRRDLRSGKPVAHCDVTAPEQAMPLIAAGDIDLHYESHGAGEAVVLVHGLGSSGADWAFQVPALAARHRVIAPDLRGSGQSAKPPGRYSIVQFADDVWRLLDVLAVERAHLVGFSLGGAVALEMALQQPARAQRLVTINSLPSYRVDHWRKWLEVHGQLAAVRLLGLPRTARGVAARLFPEPYQAPMRERVAEVVGSNPVDAYLASVRALVGWCALDRIARLQSPWLMLAAEHDYTPLAEKRGYAERLGAAFAVVRGSRHGTPFDATIATNACLAAFLAGEPLPDAEHLVVDGPERSPRHAPS